jgi:hypothetical protein
MRSSSHVRTRGPGWRVRQAPALRRLILLASLSVAGSSGAPALEAASDATYLQKTRTFHTPEAFARETGGALRVERGVDAARLAELQRAFQPLPSPEITVVVALSPAVTWIGTREGAVRLDTERGTREYFAGSRWLPDDHVIGIATQGRVTWVETPRGFARLEDAPMTLEEKSRAFVARVQARHNRWGLTADSLLKVPGDLSSNQVISTDNDGLWTAIYVAAECFRYAVTGAADARDNARAGMQAILRLESITGIPGFPARSFIRVGVDLQPADGEWHDTPDGLWRWKGDTSSDEIVGHYFVYPIYYDLVADEAERRVVASTLARITDHILDNDYQLIDVDGLRTRWGFWAPEAIWEDPDETGLRALHMLSHLRVAMHMAPSPAARAKYQAAYDTLIGTHRYHLLTRNQKIMVPGAINHSDDQLAFLSYYPLLQYEKSTQLIEVYRDSLDRSWRIERPERNPLWNVIYAVGTGAEAFDRAESVRTLREIPMDQVQWTVRNSHRRDVPTASEIDRHGRRQALVVLPYDELPMSKWNGNPYRLDGGHDGRVEDDGAYFLLPYWMGRYHRLFE